MEIADLAKIVNRGMAGEPEHACLQNLETHAIYEFSQIKSFVENGTITNVSIEDADISNEIIQRILRGNHTVNLVLDSNNDVKLYF